MASSPAQSTAATAGVVQEEKYLGELQSQLRSRLSPDAVVSLPSSEEFKHSNLRFTEYERPVMTDTSLLE